MGPNGAGKSTLAYALAGRAGYEVTEAVPRPTTARTCWASNPSQRAAKGVFLSFQYPLEIPGVPGVTFLRTALNAQKQGARRGRDVGARAFLKLVKAEKAKALRMDFDMLKRPLNVGFSGGEKKRMEILQMAVLEPSTADPRRDR